ncbi:DUF6528 family protein [Streptomyces sp. NPDC059597]|uniref:DUF6528 family protein n=1 Tax=Streptomyces sp. NPDC059597 TaxID=3346879 RepID=UPI0036A5EDF6
MTSSPSPSAPSSRPPSRRALLLGGVGAALGLALPLGGKARAATVPPVLVGDQKARKVLLLDSTKTAWDPAADPSVVQWSFTPDGDSRYADLQPTSSFTYVSEVKARTSGGSTLVLVTASYGFAAVVEYPTGKRRWAGLVAGSGPGDDLNPHSIELLPDGNVAVACSHGNAVRVYAASQGPTATDYFTTPLTTAHGVHWDSGANVLWAVGGTKLAAYTLAGTPAQPVLTEKTSVSVDLPTSDGHDVGAVAGSSDLLWVSTGSALYQYSKSARTFTPYGSTACGGGPWGGVKAVSNSGSTVLFTKPDGDLSPNWLTRYVRDASGTAAPYALADGGIYKARWWQP